MGSGSLKLQRGAASEERPKAASAKGDIKMRCQPCPRAIQTGENDKLHNTSAEETTPMDVYYWVRASAAHNTPFLQITCSWFSYQFFLFCWSGCMASRRLPNSSLEATPLQFQEIRVTVTNPVYKVKQLNSQALSTLSKPRDVFKIHCRFNGLFIYWHRKYVWYWLQHSETVCSDRQGISVSHVCLKR